jgi:hypothetical protein
MAQQKESSLFPDDTGLINPLALVSQLSVEPNVDMDIGFANGKKYASIELDNQWYSNIKRP